MFTEQTVKGIQRHRVALKAFVDVTDAAQPQGVATPPLPQADTTGAEHGDKLITR